MTMIIAVKTENKKKKNTSERHMFLLLKKLKFNKRRESKKFKLTVHRPEGKHILECCFRSIYIPTSEDIPLHNDLLVREEEHEKYEQISMRQRKKEYFMFVIK